MAFSAIKNPFENLSIQNQEKMVKSLSEIKDYFISGNSIVESINEIGNYLKTFVSNQTKILDFLTKKDAKQLSSKDQQEMVKTAKLLGPGLKLIVDAIQTYSKIPEEAVDKFVLGIEKIGDAFKKLSSLNKAIESGAEALISLGKSIFWFGVLMILSLPVYLLAAVAGPIVMLVVAGLVWLFVNTVGKYADDIESGSKNLMYMAASIILFGIAILVAAQLYGQILAGILGILAIYAVITMTVFFFTFISKYIKDIKSGSKNLMYMAASIILFGIAILVAAQLYGQILAGILGILAIYAVITMTVFFFTFISKYIKDIKSGAEMLGVMALVLLGFGLILLLASLVYAQLWVGMLGVLAIFLTIAIVVGLMILLDKLSDTIYDGVKALGIMVLIIFAVGILLLLATITYGKLVEGLVASWPILVVIGALVALMFAINSMKGNIYQGALALFVMVAAVGLVGLILYLISGYAKEMEAGLGASWPILILLGALVVIMYGLSKVKGDLIQGAIALGAISVSLLILAAALYVFTSSGFGLGDAVVLTALIIALGTIGTVLGALMEAGGLPLLGAVAMTAIGLSLLPLTAALVIYKNSKIETEDIVVFGLLIVALAFLATELGGLMLFGGLPLLGAAAMGAIGLALIPFTKSLLTYKNSKFNETDAENFIAVLEKIITGLVTTFTDLSLNQLYKLRTGISALTGVGNVMTSLAIGIQNFANMKFIEYEVVKNKDGMAVIQPKSINKLSDTDIQNAGLNFGKVIDAIVDPLRKVGEAEAAGDSWFSGGYISKGIKALTGIGGIMTGLAQGVQAFANMTFTTFKVVGTGADTKIVPASIEQIDMDVVIPRVVSTFEKVVTAMKIPLYNIGMREGTSGGIFSDGYISKGIKALTGVGAVMTDLAKGVQGFANLTFQKYKLDEKSGKLVLDGSPQTMGETEILKAKVQFRRVIDAILDPVIQAGLKFILNKDAIESFSEFMPSVSKIISTLSENVKQFATADPIKAGVNFKYFLNGILDIFKNEDNMVAGIRFKTFASNADILIKGADKLEKVAESFERVADSFGVMKDHINGMEIERLTQVTKLMGFLDGLANGESDDIVADVGSAITKGMESLKDILEEIKDQLGTAQNEPGLLDKAANALGIGPGTSSKPEPAKAKPEAAQNTQGMEQVVTAINNLKTTLIDTGIKVNANAFDTLFRRS